MKLFYFIPLLFLLASCSSEDEPRQKGDLNNSPAEIPVITLKIEIVDENGNSLLDRNHPQNWLDRNFFIKQPYSQYYNKAHIEEGTPLFKRYNEETNTVESISWDGLIIANGYERIPGEYSYRDQYKQVDPDVYYMYYSLSGYEEKSLKLYIDEINTPCIDISAKVIPTSHGLRSGKMTMEGVECFDWELTDCSHENHSWNFENGYHQHAGILNLTLKMSATDFPR